MSDALREYIEFRKTLKVVDPKDEDALFLSMQRRRMTVRAIQIMVKKYALDIPSLSLAKAKKISPHKLRRSYGTELYHESNDLYLVATGLNHNSVATTAKYYVAMDPERKKQAYTTVKLSDNSKDSNIKSDNTKQGKPVLANSIQITQENNAIQGNVYKRNN